MARRAYKTGTRWCVMRWTDVDSEYITRLHVLKTPFFAVCLHWLSKPDPEPYLHDHPVSFLSLILRGGYTENRWTKRRGYFFNHNRWWNFIRATPDDRHSIIDVRPNTVTLCLMGPKVREWGYHINPDGDSPYWEYWKSYNDRKRRGEQP